MLHSPVVKACKACRVLHSAAVVSASHIGISIGVTIGVSTGISIDIGVSAGTGMSMSVSVECVLYRMCSL